MATNSLLLDSVLIARAYGELDKDENQVPSTIGDLRLGEHTVDMWLSEAQTFRAVGG